MVKILYLAPSNSIHTKRWLERASKSGIDVYLYDQIIGLDDPGPNNSRYCLPDRRIYRSLWIFSPIVIFFGHYFYLKKILRDTKFDLIHGHWLFDVSMLAATFQPNLKMIITPWGSDVQYNPKNSKLRAIKIWVNKLIIKRLAHKSIAVCCDSEVQAQILLKAGSTRDKINIIYFGTDINIFKPENRDMTLRSKYGAEEENILVISNRSHEEVYDLPTFILAAKLAYIDNPKLRYVLAGSGSLTDALKQKISELDMEDYFYLPGRMSDEEFASSTASCDVYVSTSKSDGGLAASTAEAMACGLPVLISNFGENANWLRNESAGYTFGIGDPIKLAELITKLSFDSDLRRQMGIKGRDIIKKDNNATVEWNKVLGLYRSLV
jgi:glycosyltransferase involved in cell wall biosynthesis